MSLSTVISKWMRALLAPAKDPRLSYQDALDRYQAMVERVRQARASLATARTRLESQLVEVRQRQPGADGDQEDPFERQLQRLVSDGVSDLEQELMQLRREDEELDLAERRLLAEEQALRARREALAAHQIASQARTRVHEQLGDPAVDADRFGPLLDEAQRRADGVEDKLAAAANLTGLMAFAGSGSGEAQGLAMRYVAAGRTEASLQRKRLLATGFRCLLDLEAEHSQLQGLVQRSASDELLASAYIQTLATETHFRAVRLLADALAMMAPLHAGSEQPFSGQSELEPDQETQVGGLFEQAEQCIAALRQTRIEMADVKASGSRKRAEAAIAALHDATQNAKSIEAELENLGL
jgi:phage shock protein A